MVVYRELSLKVIKGMFGTPKTYEMDEDVTVLMKDSRIFAGKIVAIEQETFTLSNELGELNIIQYNDMKNIANTDWLGGESIENE